LNQFAEHASNAEALCVEIASILNGLRNDAVSPVREGSALVDVKQVAQKVAVTRRRYP
jgi:hypothetical protein